MAKVLVLYHSIYGHIEAMAYAVADGAREVPGADVVVKRVPETMAADVFAQAGGKANQPAPVATPAELANYDAIIFGTGTRFGNMTGQMRNFLDQTGALWLSGALVGKVVAVSKTRATVQRLDDPQFGVVVYVLSPPDGSTAGLASGQADSTFLELNVTDASTRLKKGQFAITTGRAGSPFPGGLAVGTVVHDVDPSTASTERAELRPIVDLDKLTLVKVLKYQAPSQP